MTLLFRSIDGYRKHVARFGFNREKPSILLKPRRSTRSLRDISSSSPPRTLHIYFFLFIIIIISICIIFYFSPSISYIYNIFSISYFNFLIFLLIFIHSFLKPFIHLSPFIYRKVKTLNLPSIPPSIYCPLIFIHLSIPRLPHLSIKKKES